MYKAFGSLLMEKSRNSDVMFLPCLFHGPVLGLLHGDKPLVLNCSVVRERGSRFCSAMLQGPYSLLDSVPDRKINLDLAHSECAKNMESLC